MNDIIIFVTFLICIITFIPVIVLRAKFDKRILSSHVFYILLFLGVSIIPLITSMLIGYSCMGSREISLEIGYQKSIIISLVAMPIYPLILSMIFNLESMVKNIIKIFIVIASLGLVLLNFVLGLFVGMLGGISNEYSIILIIILSLVMMAAIFLRCKSKKMHFKYIFESIIIILIVNAIGVGTDFLLCNKYVGNEYEIKYFTSTLNKEFNDIFGENNWRIRSTRTTFDKSFKNNILIELAFSENEKVEYKDFLYDEIKNELIEVK